MKDEFYYIQKKYRKIKHRRLTRTLYFLFKISNSNQVSLKEKIKAIKSIKRGLFNVGKASLSCIRICFFLVGLFLLLLFLETTTAGSSAYIITTIRLYTLIIIMSILLGILVGWIVIGILAVIEYTLKIKFSPNKTLTKPPASFLLKIALLLPEKYRKDIEQNISDMRLEYCEALSEKKICRARFIVAFYYIGLCWSVVMWISDKAKEVVGLLPKKN